MAISFACSEDDEPDPITTEPEGQNVVDVASSNDDFSTLVSAVVEADLAETLSGPGPFTVFAPNNDAFSRFLEENNLTAEQLLGNENLAEILTYHVVPGEIPSSAVEAGAVNSVANSTFYISVAPDNSIWINGNTRIIDTDIDASNGIIHVLDNVITAPEYSIAEIALAATESSEPEFTQLVAALSRAELVEAVSGGSGDNLTVFAPTDAAFEDLYDVLGVTGVDEIPLELLTSVLEYHVVPARAFSQDLRQGNDLPTLLNGQTLSVDLENLQINESGLIATSLNIHATNGVIHAIDRVLLPAMGEEVSATITLDNVGASAYVISSINGEGASGELDVENAAITLQAGLRYTFVNDGGSAHPLDFRDSEGNILLAQGDQEGSFEGDSEVAFEVDGANVSFTLTNGLAEELAVYRCTAHPSMEGEIIITD
ncbi:Sensory subunit of low CO2-induced protein complex, putative [Indibacter alkaliphilus LW1]|uniref:Sensory subunit of low CO2-induced protein complex, putative n=1 Tax=Indibacter alkaliphilus (strain CCUG 57479 / KCTC 22604 / LW1) TaxID=1189612 RepID=S2D005_INDAL|nr:fasciclin domain-containing protein [Indibacter alkaliphilus]EOZ92194.1 Sensory subunit of low CO2-induced protein complex, putative [Indibacter alkaliphilus LW1]